MRPSLIIGLGTTGLRILENLQHFIYEAYGQNFVDRTKENRVVLINIETDESAFCTGTPSGSIIERIPAAVDTRSIPGIRRGLTQSGVDVSWFPERLDETLAATGIRHNGAGNLRLIGRIGLWSPPNFTAIYNKLQSSFQTVVGQGAERPIVIVAGTLFGGTCSGMFIDIGYLLRTLGGHVKADYMGLFMIPQPNLDKVQKQYASCWAALEDLEYFRTNEYNYIWPNGIRYDGPNYPPYDFCYLVSTKYDNDTRFASFLPDIKTLEYISAHFLFCYICGLDDAIQTVSIDRQGGTYRSFGFSGVSYPRYLLSQRVACDVSEEFIIRLTNKDIYYTSSQNEAKTINPAEYNLRAKEFLEEIIIELSGDLNNFGRESLIDKVKEFTKEWRQGLEISGIRNEFKYNELGKAGKILALMEGKQNSIRNKVVEAINKKLIIFLNETENLSIAEHFIDGLSEHSRELIKFWEQQGIKKEIDSLNKAINDEPLDLLGFLSFDRSKRNEEAIWKLADKAKLFILSNILDSLDFIGDVINTEPDKNISGFTFTESKKKKFSIYPTKGEIEKIRSKLMDAKQNIINLRDKLNTMLKGVTPVIKLIWTYGSFDNDLSKAKERITPSYHAFADLSTFLKEILEQNREAMIKLIFTFQKKIDVGFGDVNVKTMIDSLLRKEHAQSDRIIDQLHERAIHVLLPVPGITQTGTKHGTPSITMYPEGYEVEILQNAINQFTTFKPIPELKTAILFYQENHDNNMNPLRDLEHKEYMENQRNTAENGALHDCWEFLMDPYQVRRKRISPQAEKTARIINNMVIEWVKHPKSGEFSVKGSRFPIFEVKSRNEETELSCKGQRIIIREKSPDRIQVVLSEELINNRLFLANIINTLKELQPDQGWFQDQKDRWSALGFSESEIDILIKDCQNLSNYLK